MDQMLTPTLHVDWWRVCVEWISKTLAVMSGQPIATDNQDGVSVANAQSESINAMPPLVPEEMQRFKDTVLPLLDAAYSMARYLLRDRDAAEDVVQEAYLRALRAFKQYRGGDIKSWLLAIVRNCCMTWIAKDSRNDARVVRSEDEMNAISMEAAGIDATPEKEYDAQQRAKLVRELIQALSDPLREVLLLRESEGLSYAQISGIMQIPVGTVMSRLARARAQLYSAFVQHGLVPE